MAEEVGVAFVRLVPSLRGFGPEAQRALNDATTGPATTAGRTAGSRFAGAFKTALLGAGVLAGAALVGGVTEALDQGRIVGKLRAQLGATGPEAERLGKVAGELFAGAIVTDFQQGADTIRAVMSAGLVPPDATNRQIKSISTNVADLANTFDLDLGEAATAVGQLVRSGMAPDAKAGLDLIAAGLEGADTRAGDVLETVTEYAPQFQKLGISGQTAFGLMQQALDANVKDTDKLADTVKEFGVRAVDDAPAIRDAFKAIGLDGRQIGADVAAGGDRAQAAFGTVLDAMRETGTDSAATQLALQDIFGGPGEDLGAALFALDMDKANQAIGSTKGAADDLGEGLRDNAGARVTEFKNTLQQAFIDLLGNQVIPAIAGFGSWLQRNSGLVKTVAMVIAAVLVPALILMAVNATRAAVTTVAAWVTSGASAIASAATQTMAAARVVAAWVMMAGRALAAAARMAASWLIAMGPVGLIIAAVVALVALVVANWDTIKAKTLAVWDWVWNKIKQVAGFLVKIFMNFTLVGLIIKHWTTIKTKTLAIWNGIVDWVKGIPGKLVGFFLNWTLPGLIIKHWGRIKSGSIRVAMSLVSWVRGLPRRIASAVGNLGSLLYNKGRDVVSGLWRGIKSMGSWLRSTLTGWAKDLIPGPMAEALGIGSPSKVLADEVGRWVPEGIVVGMRGGLGDIEATAQLTAAAAVPAAPVNGAAGRATAAAAPTVVIDGQGLPRALREWLSHAVKTQGGGSVNTWLGLPNNNGR